MPCSPPPCTSPGRLTTLARGLIVVWLVVICFDTGCSARCAGHSAASASRKRQIKQHVFKQTPQQVFDAARAEVLGRGFSLPRPATIKDALYTTPWRVSAGEQQALSVRIDKLLTGGVKLKIHEIVERKAPQERDRRRLYQMELQVIRRLEPVKARAIELIAQAYRRTAEQGARGCGCSETCALQGCESCHACQNCAVTPPERGRRARGGTR